MMEGEPATPGVARLPDEETAFVGRKVEAPKRRQRLQQQRAQRKRVAVLTVSAVTVLAFGAVCVFLTAPSGTSEEVKTAVSQAMSSDPAGATADTVFVPSFAVYDEDGDGKVTIGEFLDRLAINRDAALQRVDESSLNETEKTRVTDLLKEDFGTHSDCVALRAQQRGDEVMTRENFDEVYKELTTKFCPTKDDRIPDSYQVKEIATGQEELAPIEVDPAFDGSSSSSASASSSGSDASTEDESAASEGAASASSGSQSSAEAEWKPEQPVAPPRPVTDNNDAKTEDGISGSEPGDEKPWRPSFPTDPPFPSKADTNPSGWNPNEPTDPPVPSKATSAAGEPEWYPTVPTDPPSVVPPSDDNAKTESTSKDSASKPSDGVGTAEWNPDFPTDPPSHAYNGYSEAVMTPTYGESTATQSNPEVAAQESPFGKQSTTESEYPTGAYNTYTGGATEPGEYTSYAGAQKTTTYGETTAETSSPDNWMPLVGGQAAEPAAVGQMQRTEKPEQDKKKLRGMPAIVP
ncbi:hypothetical protein PHYPSEUDO_012577 [Phytophthora pseudosyringae]|uniref:EF-hand domain-containing protein n=1 Tax=Phytophthora pseudosyringae TaxID=221518 RepID=A0A8T1V6H4_9STRA|nr:hypothetical protein PHYPSEUDO_012577 [Phytophthora pseudosyringae]